MTILHKYILNQFLRNFFLCLAGLLFLFLIFDFMDHVDNILVENVSVWIVVQYFLYKIPLTITLMLPIAMLVATLFTFGILAKNSEITAMRTAGVRVLWLARPVLITGIFASLVCLLINETLVPFSIRRVREIYNIDIKQKDKRGSYSGSNLWWRGGNQFYSASFFDSRTKSFSDLSLFELNGDFRVNQRLDADKTVWINKDLGWSMEGVTKYLFKEESNPTTTFYKKLPLPISAEPKDFFEVETDPYALSFVGLRKFIQDQQANGLPVKSYLADLYEKIAFPFINLIVVLVSLPFALRPARTGSMATSFLAGLIIGFTYFAVHSFSVALGRAELYPPLLAAWFANLLLGLIGVILNLGAESPS